MGIVQEFREFAIKGNAVDMAVGIVIGVAFTKVVTSLVNDVIMPPIGMLIGGVDFSDLVVKLREARVDEAGVEVAAVDIRYGLFVMNVIDFLIIAFTIFMVVRLMNKLIRKREPVAA
jgi:large conductance mechanosensitive channel